MYFFILYVVMCATDMHSLIKGNLLACLLMLRLRHSYIYRTVITLQVRVYLSGL